MGRGRARRAPRARSDSSSARSAGGGGSRRRSLGSVFDRLEELSGAWRVLHGPVGDDRRPGLGDDLLQLAPRVGVARDRKSTRLNSSHLGISYAVFCLKKKKQKNRLAHMQNKE